MPWFTRKTAQALKDLYGIEISHQQVANYCKTAALVVKPFVDNYNYPKSSVFTADETYIKVRGIKGYIWFIMDAASRSIIGYRVSDNHGVGPCILAMHQAFLHLKKFPKNFKFIADGYSAYPLAAQQFDLESKGKFKFDITQVIGLTNDDEVSKKHRPYKQMIERLNRTYKMSYRPTNGFDSYDGANYDLALSAVRNKFSSFITSIAFSRFYPIIHFSQINKLCYAHLIAVLVQCFKFVKTDLFHPK